MHRNSDLSLLPAQRYVARVYATAFPSVCLCVIRVLCIKSAKHFVKFLLPPDSSIILVFRHRGSLLNSYSFTPNGRLIQGGDKIGRFLTNKSMFLGNGARYPLIVAIKVE